MSGYNKQDLSLDWKAYLNLSSPTDTTVKFENIICHADINPITLKRAKTQWSFGPSESNRVNKSIACGCQGSALVAFRKF